MNTELLEALKSRNLAIFIGADLPEEITGLPSRSDLATRLAGQKDLPANLSLADVTQRVSQAGSRWEFTSFLRDTLDSTGKSPQKFHRNILKLAQENQLETIITTAYDNLLETVFQQSGTGYNRVIRGSDLNFINPSRTTILKLYGDIQQPDSLVVTDQDHFNLLRNPEKEALLNEVRRTFRRNTLLFLGYNLTDPDFRFLFDQIAESRFARTAFAVWPNLSRADVNMWRDRGIMILDADPFEILSSHEIINVGFAEPGGEKVINTQSGSSLEQIFESIRRIESKIDQGRAEDRETAVQMLTALSDNRVAIREANLIMTDLQNWSRSVQESGIPVNPELRAKLDALSTHSAGVNDYLHFAIPLIPGVLSYDIELGTQHQIDLKAIWAKIKSKIKVKNEEEKAASEKLYGKGNRWAVLVGVNQYEDQIHYEPLTVCVKDAESLCGSFIANGYGPDHIKMLTDQTSEPPIRDNILVALNSLAQATEYDDTLVFFYSGHGDEYEGEAYLVGKNGRHLALEDTAIKISRIKKIMEQSPAKAKIIILDACHSGANIGGKGPKFMTPEFFQRVFDQAEGIAILASCKQDQVSYEWQSNQSSVFTYYLLEALKGKADLDGKGFITVQDVNRHVSNGVKLWSSQRNLIQTPTFQAEVAGDLILAYLAPA